jgi:hypothetical protein
VDEDDRRADRDPEAEDCEETQKAQHGKPAAAIIAAAPEGVAGEEERTVPSALVRATRGGGATGGLAAGVLVAWC